MHLAAITELAHAGAFLLAKLQAFDKQCADDGQAHKSRDASPCIVPAPVGPFPPGEVSWVPEARLPLWLIRTYEEKARRIALVAEGEALREAARGESASSLPQAQLAALLQHSCMPSMHSKFGRCAWHACGHSTGKL